MSIRYRIRDAAILSVSILAPALGLAPHALAATPGAKGQEVCKLGARVTDRSNRSGIVVEAKGNDCRVKLDDGSTRYYLQWMLKSGSPGAQSHADGPLAKGRYECWAAAGIAGTLRLEIRGDTSYAGNGKSGNYTYDARTRKISFQSGPWAGFYGGRLGSGKIGISSRPGGSYNTVCDLKS